MAITNRDLFHFDVIQASVYDRMFVLYISPEQFRCISKLSQYNDHYDRGMGIYHEAAYNLMYFINDFGFKIHLGVYNGPETY